jgi:hypothetical protein
LIAALREITATVAAKVQGDEELTPAHDALTRLLHRLEPDASTLWADARTQLNMNRSILVIDDSTLDKPYAKKIELVTLHWSGKYNRVVSGLNLLSLLWRDGDVVVWATEMNDLERVKCVAFAWAIENYHSGIKQFCLIERAQVRSRRVWRNHPSLCLRAFLRLESHCYRKGIQLV